MTKTLPDLKAYEQTLGDSSAVIHRRAAHFLEKSSGPFLDLGCGKGHFLKLLGDLGKQELTGCDAYDYPGEVKDSKYSFKLANLNDRLPFDDLSFSAVTALEVIEHLENPRHLVREIHRILRPGGKVVLSTPNIESFTSLTSLLFRGQHSAFMDRCYPAHITPLLAMDIKRILLENSFDSIQITFTHQGRIPATSQHWQNWFPFLKGKLFSDNLLAIAQKPNSKGANL